MEVRWHRVAFVTGERLSVSEFSASVSSLASEVRSPDVNATNNSTTTLALIFITPGRTYLLPGK